jgi:hypothetical protein
VLGAATEIALHSLCVIPQLVQRNRRRLPIVRSDQGAEASRGPPAAFPAGKVMDDKELRAEGKFDKAKGAAHDAAGDVKDAFRNATKTP